MTARSPQQAVGSGGVSDTPLGFIEVTSSETRFVSFKERRRIVRALVLGSVVGIVF